MSFIWVSQTLDDKTQLAQIPESALSVWLPRGWEPCDPPVKSRPEKPAAPAAPEPAPAEAVAKTTKKAPASGPDKSEGTV